MPGQEKRTGLKHQELQQNSPLTFEGGRANLVRILTEGDEVLLYLDSHEGSRSHILLHGKYKHYGAGLEFVETAPRGYW